MIVFYSRTCESCSGNQALRRMKSFCDKKGVEFQERRTILWRRYEEEANAIMEAIDIDLPFFYNTETGQALHGDSFTSVDEIEKML